MAIDPNGFGGGAARSGQVGNLVEHAALVDSVATRKSGNRANAHETMGRQVLRMAQGFNVTSGGKVSGYSPVPASPGSQRLRPGAARNQRRSDEGYIPESNSGGDECGKAPLHMRQDFDCNGIPDEVQPPPGINFDYLFDIDGNGVPDEVQAF